MKKYFRVFKTCFSNALSFLLTYRTDFGLKLGLGIGWSLVNLSVIQIIFLHTNSFNGWSKASVVLVMFTMQMCIEPAQIITANLVHITDYIRTGSFDIVVSKPIDSQFLATFLQPDLSGFIFLTTYSIPMIWMMIVNHLQIIPSHLPLYVLMVLIGNIIFILLRLATSSLNFWWQKLDNIQGLLFTFTEFSKYPITILPNFLRIIFYTIVPIAFLATVPAEVLLGVIPWKAVIGSLVLIFILAILARALWVKGSKNYSSASG